MSLDPQAWNQQDETVSGIPSGQFYVRVADTNTATVPKNESVSGIPSGQFSARAAATNTGTDLPNEENSSASKPQTDAQPASKGKNNNLNKALIGGLVGATLGTLAAALANKRTAQGANHAAKGVGKAVKSVTEGVNHAAKGVGAAVKNVTEGVNYAVVGTVVDALKDTTDSAKKSVEASADKLGQTADYMNRTDYVNPADQQEDAQTTYVLIPVEKRVIERTIIVEPPMPADSGEANFTSEEVAPPAADSGEANFTSEEVALLDNEQASQFNQQPPEFQG